LDKRLDVAHLAVRTDNPVVELDRLAIVEDRESPSFGLLGILVV
jgi:hypothetical protein